MAAEAGKTGKLNIGEALNDFIQKNRKGLFAGLAAITVVLIGFAVFVTVRDNMQARALSRAEEFKRRYEALRIDINSEDPAAAEKQEEITALEAELNAFEETNSSGYGLVMAYSISAGIAGDRKNWAEAETAWVHAAAAAGKSYFKPIALYNAAASAENQNNNDRAIELYNQVLESGDGFPEAPRAQFAVGRILEIQGNRDGALEAYRALTGKWPGDSLWANLAQSRILALTK
ncbi:MAG: tetratricopeptide repeat protein [Spirochaetaceae bacterium]|jgi:predicted negative regulator of RcsB-dependent stress response|nr:tetratricopeptide repeat protein [Spirochaetaceae bacterium]